MTMDLASNETSIRHGWANLQRGWEAVGGHLTLTSQRLHFSPHRFNVRTEPAEIHVSAIQRVEPCWTRFLGLVPLAPNGLAVRTRDEVYRFALYRRSAWIDAIRSASARVDD